MLVLVNFKAARVVVRLKVAIRVCSRQNRLVFLLWLHCADKVRALLCVIDQKCIGTAFIGCLVKLLLLRL